MLSDRTRELIREFAYYKSKGDNSSATQKLWQQALISAFENDEANCDDNVL